MKNVGVVILAAALGVGVAAAQTPDAAVPAVTYGEGGTHLVVPERTLIRLMTDQGLHTKRSKAGTAVSFTVNADVLVNDVVAIPRGATVRGAVVTDKKGGMAHGAPELVLRLDSLELAGESYPLYAYQFKVVGVGKDAPAGRYAVIGAFYGAIAGTVAAQQGGVATGKDEAVDASAGAAAGAGALAAAAVAGPRPVVAIPAESQMDFYLAAPVSVLAVSRKEAERLMQRVRPGGPVLYVRGDTP